MRKAILVGAAVLASLFVVVQPVRAADYNGKLLDGSIFTAMVYTSHGAEFALVTFVRDEARVLLLDGETLTVNLNDSSVMNPHFIGGTSLDGHFYRIDIDDASFLYSTEILPVLGDTCVRPGLCMPGPDGIFHNGFSPGMNDGVFFAPNWGVNGGALLGRH